MVRFSNNTSRKVEGQGPLVAPFIFIFHHARSFPSPRTEGFLFFFAVPRNLARLAFHGVRRNMQQGDKLPLSSVSSPRQRVISVSVVARWGGPPLPSHFSSRSSRSSPSFPNDRDNEPGSAPLVGPRAATSDVIHLRKTLIAKPRSLGSQRATTENGDARGGGGGGRK